MDALQASVLHEAEPFQQSGDSRYIMSARFQPVRQEIRHLLLDGKAAGPALQQGADLDLTAAQQNAGALGPIQSLVAGHGDEGRAQLRHVQRQDAR